METADIWGLLMSTRLYVQNLIRYTMRMFSQMAKRINIPVSRDTRKRLIEIQGLLQLALGKHFSYDDTIKWMCNEVRIEKFKTVTETSSSVEAPQSALQSKPASSANNR